MYLLGYDIGSATIKTALINAETHEVLKVVQYPTRDMDIISRQIGWAEQLPETWWSNLCISTQKIIAESNVNPKDIKGIGISYQMHGLVLVDKEMQVLRASIIWCDSRAAPIGWQAFQDLGQEFCLRNYLNSPGNFTASKLKWVKDNEPEVYEKIHKVLLPGDYIVMKLTGNISTTTSGLSEGIFWNFKEKGISERLLNYFEVDSGLLPEVIPNFSKMGDVTRDAAIQTGLAPGTPVTYRAGDQPNNAVALNVLQPGEIAATSGTSGVVYGIVDKPLYDEKSRVNAFAHVNYEKKFDRIGILLCINGAGIEYSWIKQQIARSGTSYQDMDRMASTVPVGSEGICNLPFGNGSERIFGDRNLGAHFFNLRFNRHTRAHIYRASLEGVAFSFVHGINILKEMGIEVNTIRVGNDNMFQSKIFSMTIATLLGSHIEVVDTTGAIGAARASGVGCGIYSSLQEALQGVKPTELYEPTLNHAMCFQAYNYWTSSLNNILNQSKDPLNLKGKSNKNNGDLQSELKEKNKTLASQAAEISFQKEIVNNFYKELEKLTNPSSKTEDVKAELLKLKRKLKKQIVDQNDWDAFEEHFDLLHDNFIQNLKDTFPGLTYEELKLCSLLKLKLSTKEIATKLSLSIRGVETKRYRLRKKLKISKSENISEFLDSV